MEEHTNTCKQQLVQCRYRVVGCEAKMTHEDIQKHYKEMIEEHLLLSINKTKVLFANNLQLVKEVNHGNIKAEIEKELEKVKQELQVHQVNNINIKAVIEKEHEKVKQELQVHQVNIMQLTTNQTQVKYYIKLLICLVKFTGVIIAWAYSNLNNDIQTLQTKVNELQQSITAVNEATLKRNHDLEVQLTALKQQLHCDLEVQLTALKQ